MQQIQLKFDYMNYAPTSEQMDIYSIDLDKHSIFAIRALAGTGKTTTLLDFAKLHPKKKFVYVALNVDVVNAVRKEAKKLNITNIEFYTIHAYANQATKEYSKGREKKEITIDFIKDYLNLSNHRDAFVIKTVLSKYCSQTLDFSAFSSMILSENIAIIDQFELNNEEKIQFINYIKILLDDFENGNINFVPHSVYLKYFIDNQKLINADCLMVDESQDLNDAMFSFVESQIKLGLENVIAVGDQNQSVYGFLRSRDIMKKLVDEYGAIVKTLTRSFRFHPNSKMEEYANRFLLMRGEQIYGAAIHKDSICRNEAFIARTNMQVLTKALELIKDGVSFHLMGGTKSIDEDLIMDLWNLMLKNGKAIKSGIIREYSNISEFKEWATEKNLVEFISGCNFVNQIFQWQQDTSVVTAMKMYGIYDKKIPFPKKILITINAFNKRKSSVILSTFHKSKGLGIDRVTILPNKKDGQKNFMGIPYGVKIIKNPILSKKTPIEENFFQDIQGNFGYLLMTDDQKESLFDEYNLMYVACTRAKKEMYVEDVRMVASANFIAALYVVVAEKELTQIKIGDGRLVDCYKVEVNVLAGKTERYFISKENALEFLYYIKERRV